MLLFYVEVARTAFRRQLIYRWANLAGLITNIFFGVVFSFVYIGLYQARPLVAGYDVHDTLRYSWLVQSMIMVILPFGWRDLMLTIRTGEVVSDLSKPCDFCWYWFSREVGRSLYYLLCRCIPIYIAGMLLFGIGVPGELFSWLAYGLALPLGALLGIAYRMLYNIGAFWLIEARAVGTMAEVVGLFFAGSYVPIPLLPLWLRGIVEWLPFSGLLNLPVQVLLGKLSGSELYFALARQLFWVIALVLLLRLLVSVATRRVVSQGG
ncbi:ABC transporter permease [Ktedonosporobacter rubrisoli]|nr:ABC-2 family transporter protein [Ktedonosporobacter rubrisoli]